MASSRRSGNTGAAVVMEILSSGVQAQKFQRAFSPLKSWLLSFLTPCSTVSVFKHVVTAGRGDHRLMVKAI